MKPFEHEPAADVLDVAAERAQIELDAALADRRRRNDRLFRGTADPDRVCEECGAPIGARRLELVPGATRCVDCQEIAERCAASAGLERIAG